MRHLSLDKKTMNKHLRIALGVALASLPVLAAACKGTREPEPPTSSDGGGHADKVKMDSPAAYLHQGWSRAEAQDFYYTPQGSQIIPYTWFLELEQAGSTELFRDNANLDRMGFIVQPPDPQKNRDGLPIGFVRDDSPGTVEMPFAVRKSLLGAEYAPDDFPTENSWMGLTCAACHTAELRHGGRRVIVDGAPAMLDYQTFARELLDALATTGENQAKFTSFAKRVLEPSYNETEAEVLRRRLRAYTAVMGKVQQRNTGPIPYGFARLDAFGAILNAVCVTALEIPGNFAPATAPVSFPFLWNAPHLDWVQWNGSIADPLARNVGEVLGVFAHFKLTGTPEQGQFTSTANIPNLDRLESLVSRLTAPAWPEELLGSIDVAKAERGRLLFVDTCSTCHSVRGADGKFPMTSPNKFGKQFIKTVMVPVGAIGTDPQLIANLRRTADPGALRPYLPESLKGAPVVPAPLLLSLAGGGVIHRWASEAKVTPEQLDALSGYRDRDAQAPNPAAYKARPLDGIWATAPFLHNGSVPNLYQLLLPAKDRTSFHLGNREFDPKSVGFATGAHAGSFEFRSANPDATPILGNSNAGHEGKSYTQVKDGGAWRDFTDDERWALVEYMKTLR